METIITKLAFGAVGIIATIALAYTSGTSSKVDLIQQKDSSQDQEIALIKQEIQRSNCINNQNTVNIGKALNVPVVTDGTCIK